MAEKLKWFLRQAPALLGLVLLVAAIYVVRREFHHLKIEDIARALQAIPLHALVTAAAWTVLSYGVLTFYDRLGTIYAGRAVSYRRVAFASFCAYTLAHNLGFAAVSGAAVRYRLYAHWGLTALQIGKVIAFCSLTFGLGGMVLGGTLLFLEPTAVPFLGDRLPAWMMYAAAALLWAVVVAYVVIARSLGRIHLFGHDIELPGWRMAILQVLVATADVAVTAAIFYSLLPPAPGLTYPRFLGIYVASYTAGLAANLPGGLGVFDTAMLLGLDRYLEAPTIVGGILVFRLYYYIVPLFLAGGLFAANEIMLRGRSLLGVAAPPPAAAAPSRVRISEPDLAVAAGTGAVALCGFLLLSLGVLESRPDFSWLVPAFADVAAQAGQFIPSLIGAALMMLAVGLAQRVNLAWGSTLAVLLLAAAFTLAQGEPLWIPGVLLLAVLLIAPYRSAFYRHARLFSEPLQPATAIPLLALVLCVLALAAFERHVRWLANNSWWEVILSRDVPNSLRASVALTVLLGLAAMWRLLRPRRVSWQKWNAEARLRYAALGGTPPAIADGMVWGEAERAAIPFRRLGRVLLALGDPVGAEADRISAVWRMRDLAQQWHLNPAVWRAGRSLLKVYADLGLSALPLDEEGRPCEAPPDPDQSTAEHFLVCIAEQDLPSLLPLLADLDRAERRPAADGLAATPS